MFLKYFENVLFIDASKFAIPYSCFLILMSVLFHVVPVPPSYLSNSKNVFNIFFMKYSYYYTVGFLIPFVFLLNLIYGFGKLKYTIVPIIRQLVNFGILLFMSYEFNIYGSLVGDCQETTSNSTIQISDFQNKEFTCTLYGYSWKSFDISGHIYHNIYGVLIIMEEASSYKLWALVQHVVYTVVRDKSSWKQINHIVDEQIGVKEKAALIKWYERLSLVLKINFFILGVIWVGLNIANILTAIYFHTVVENIIAAIVALSFWFLYYRVVFPLYGTQPHTLEAHRDILLQNSNDDTHADETDNIIKAGVQTSYNSV